MTLGNKTWKKGVITKRLDERSYEVDTNEGTLRRNRVYLRQTHLFTLDNYVTNLFITAPSRGTTATRVHNG